MDKVRATIAAATLLSIAAGPVHAATQAELEANKQVVAEAMKALQHQDVQGVAALLADDYIQHNPNAGQGKAGFVAFFTPLWKDGPTPGHDWVNPPVLVTAEGDILQMTFKRMTPEPGDPSKIYESFWWDAFRVKDGKLVEHWDPATKPAR